MYFQVIILENARKDIFTDKQTTSKVPLIFFNVTVLPKREQLYYTTLPKTNKLKLFY